MNTVDYNLYWGDMHTQFKPQWRQGDWGEFLEQSFAAARDYLDFYPIVYYPAVYYNTPEGLRTESVGWRDEFEPEWRTLTALVKKHHEPGRFVTFAGYEWTGDRTRWGDHNVFYFEDDPPLDLSMTIDELYANLRKQRAIAIPHHTGYAPRERSKDWDHYDEDVSPFAEIFSAHGCSEGGHSPLTLNTSPSMGPGVSGCTIQDGLAKGCRIGLMASGDNQSGFPGLHGTGLTACYAKELTREALWDAFVARRVYGVTGDRMRLGFWINDGFMGDVVQANGSVDIRAELVGSQAIDRIELIRNNRVIATHCHNGAWDVPDSGRCRVKLQVECGWGPKAHYGLEVEQKTWNLALTGRGAEFRSVEGCFTHAGQSARCATPSQCDIVLTTGSQNQHGTGRDARQSIIVEIEGAADGRVDLACDEIRESFTLRELMAQSRLLVLKQEVEATVKEQFGLSPDQFENSKDVFFHNAYKIKLHQAVAEAGYTASLSVTDDALPPGRSLYYVRASQLNGQYAWSSPIWIEVG